MSITDLQVVAAARALCDRSPELRGAGLWEDDGPTSKCLELRIDGGDPEWSESTALLWNLSWALYDHAQMPELWELLEGLGRENLAAVGSMLTAFGCGTNAVEGWLAAQAVQARAA